MRLIEPRLHSELSAIRPGEPLYSLFSGRVGLFSYSPIVVIKSTARCNTTSRSGAFDCALFRCAAWIASSSGLVPATSDASFIRALSEPVVSKGLLDNDASAAEKFYDRVRDEIARDPHTYALTKTQIYVLLTVR